MGSRRVLIFVLASFSLYLIWSITLTGLGISAGPWDRINLVSEIIPKPEPPGADSSKTATALQNNRPTTDSTGNLPRSFQLYHAGNTLTRFQLDSAQPACPRFMQRLHELRTGKKRRVRIAYFGDSVIEGDLLTQTLRKRLHQAFGGSGVGFVPINCVSAKFRETARTDISGDWKELTFQDKSKDLYLSGHLFFGNQASFNCKDQVNNDAGLTLEKALLCGPLTRESSISYNNTSIRINPTATFQRIVLARDQRQDFTISVKDAAIPIYGVSIEPDSGVVVDNFSFRGITGVELGNLDTGMLSAINRENPYDLIVFQYGVNLMFRPNDKNFTWYEKSMASVLNRFKQCFNKSDFLIVSTADRAFRYDGEYKSALGIDSLIATQARLAYQLDFAFFNLFSTMGGHNSIVDWANRNPSLANKDYVHPNHRGAEELANLLFQSINTDYRKYVAHLTQNTKAD